MRSWQFRSAALKVLPAVLGCIALVSAASEARSQATNCSQATKYQYEYAAKFLCGSGSGAGIVAPGTYFTSINVHNPNEVEKVNFCKKFVIAPANEQQGGPISDRFPTALAADEAYEIECADILRPFGRKAAKGFVVLLSPAVLDVVAVYTAAAPAPGSPVVTMFMERVPHQP